MANEKNKINELVSDDDDPTAELELPVLMPDGTAFDDDLESAASTSGFERNKLAESGASISALKSDLASRSETIHRLQFDIEQLRSKWLGLETEIGAREEITTNLNRELADIRDALSRKKKLLKKRDESIKSLKDEVRERHEEQQALRDTVAELREETEQARVAERQLNVDELQQTIDTLEQRIRELEHANQGLSEIQDTNASEATQKNRQLMSRQAGQLASNEMLIKELQAQTDRSEAYADSMRRQLQGLQEASASSEETGAYLQQSLDEAVARASELGAKLDVESANATELSRLLEELKSAHAEEIRMIRFELGAAEETVSEQALISEELASDLVETRGFRNQLESMLSESEESNKENIEKLERENRKLRREAKELDEKLETKSEAINCLLAELAKKSQQIESISEIEDVIQEIDDRMSDRIDDRPALERDRVTRVLIGSVEGQELRFPLFKDRLTIGRTEQNDIQLKAPYISRRHAVMVTEGDSTRVVDWGSKNGVFVNSKRVTEHFLQNGDIVAIGTAKFRYEERPKRDT